MGRFDFKGHARNLNWQATTTYAEDGKRKTVVQYYDGSLYSRQTVTKDNTTNTTIVAESIYDYQGRPVIQVLPAPTLNSVIQYTRSFNTGLNGNAYDRDNFDLLPDASMYCVSVSDQMDTLSGAAQYYSSNNPLKNTDFHKYIPDAKGYPFSQVQYTADNTGRISRQSGVGPMFKLGSGHETKYYYGTPDQRELDALFGTEVGHYSHYYKTMVRDANGQFSVTYTDMLGKTIATALAGTPPDSIKLDLLSSNIPRTITETISDPQSAVIKGLVMESKKGLLVSKPGLHQFSYQLSPQSLQLENCSSTTICYDCLYDLEITITDDCNNQKLGGQPFDTVIHNFSLSAIDTSCSIPAQGFTLNFSKYLEEGSYEITKKLSVSKFGSDFLRDSVYLKNNTCKSLEDFAREQRQIQLLNQQCYPSCQSCMDSVGTWEDFRNRFIQRAGIVEDTASYRGAILDAYNKALEACSDLCGNKTELDRIRTSILLDLTPPSGQYANLDSAADKYSIFYVPTDAQGTPTATANYTKPTTYVDADGNPDFVYDEQVGAMVPPQQLSPEAFVQKFKLSWAQALLPYHPEFCKLSQYESISSSEQWNKRFESTETFAEALKKGYLNPTNNPTFPFNRYNGQAGQTDVDPLSTTYNNGTNQYKSKLETQLREFRDNNFGGASGMSMWGLSSAITLCRDQSLDCYNQHGNDNSAFDTVNMCTADLDMAWRTFRQMYLDVKREIINSQISTTCNGQPGSATAAQITAANHQVHFSDALELLQLSGITIPSNQSQANAAQQQAKGTMSAYSYSNCAVYASRWWQQMKPCNFTNEDSAIIIPRLIQVCSEGSDMNHPMGASSVKPTSSYKYRSFDDVLKQYADSAKKTYNTTTCNVYLITEPLPYELPNHYSDVTVYSKPDSCQCSRISNLFVSYEQNSLGYPSFSSYVNAKNNTSMSEEDLQNLLQVCNQNSTCNTLNKPVRIPVALQCGSENLCIDCAKMAQTYSQFLIDFPTAYKTANDTSAVLGYYSLFANYFNTKLGFTKTYQEYQQFLQTCNISYYTPSSTARTLVGPVLGTTSGSSDISQVSCDTLASVASQFSSLYPVLSSYNLVTRKVKRILYPKIEYLLSCTGINKYYPPQQTVWPSYWKGSGLRDSGFVSKWFRNNITFVKFDVRAIPPKAVVDSVNLKISPVLSEPFNTGIYWADVTTKWDTTLTCSQLSVSYYGAQISVYAPMYQYTSNQGNLVYTYNCKNQYINYFLYPWFYNGNALHSVLNPAVAASNDATFLGTNNAIAMSDPDARPRLEVTVRIDTLYGCKDLIVGYFNSKLNTNLTYDSLVSVFRQKCGYDLSINCYGDNNLATLCERKDPIFPTVSVEDINNCTDSAFFAVSKGTELFNEYKDSLNNAFDSAYRASAGEIDHPAPV